MLYQLSSSSPRAASVPDSVPPACCLHCRTVITNHRTAPSRAGEGNRTLVSCLEGRRSTIELHPRHQTPALLHCSRHTPYAGIPAHGVCGLLFCAARLLPPVGNEGFEPSKARGQQIYSLSPLTAWVIPLFVLSPSQSPAKSSSAALHLAKRPAKRAENQSGSQRSQKSRASEGT